MAVKKAAKKKPVRRRKKALPRSRGLDAHEVAQAGPDAERLAAQIRSDGGEALASYREPFGGHAVVFAALPIDKVEPTPYQRDASEAHVKKLARAIERVDYFLDPLIAVHHGDRYWTPNGNHRLQASRLLGARSVMALVLGDPDVAYQILALNTEKAHNLKERSLEVIRMYRGMVGIKQAREDELAALFEEPSYVTLGIAYERRPRYSAGAYQPVVKRLESFLEESLEDGLRVREARADKLLELDDAVTAVVDALKAKGMVSPYLKAFVVARINYLRFKKDTSDLDFEETIDKLTAAAKKFNVEKVKREDIARAGGPPDTAEE